MKLDSKIKSKINRNLFLFVMAIPALYGVFRYFAVNGYSILLAFSEGEPFVDPFTLRNFKMFLTDMQGNGILALALKNTLKYFVVGLLQQFICYVAAYFLYKKIPGHKIFRFTFYLPCLIAPVITTAIFMELIRVGGPLYKVLYALFGIEYNSLLSTIHEKSELLHDRKCFRIFCLYQRHYILMLQPRGG